MIIHIVVILLWPHIRRRRPRMRKAMPTITESVDELQRRMKSEPAGKNGQPPNGSYLAPSGQPRHRQEIATLLGVHRHSVAAWVKAYAEGGLAHALSYQRPMPPVHRRITETALTALPEKLN